MNVLNIACFTLETWFANSATNMITSSIRFLNEVAKRGGEMEAK